MFHPLAFQRVLCRAGLANLWHACTKWQAENFLGMGHSLLSKFFCALAASLYCETYVYTRVYIYIYIYIYISECIEIVFELLGYQIIMREKHFYTYRKRWEVLTGYLSLERRLGGDWANM